MDGRMEWLSGDMSNGYGKWQFKSNERYLSREFSSTTDLEI
jgi:hypothetical protein